MEEKVLERLLCLSNKATKKNEVPVAAIIVHNNKIIAESYNKRIKSNIVLDHAEVSVIKKASRKLKDWRLDDCELYITLEPCNMCKEIIKASRIKKVYYLINKSSEKKDYNKTEIIKINNLEFEEKYKMILSCFFSKKRKQKEQ